MARSENQKRKLLYIKDYLEKSARRDKPVSASALCEMLQRDYDIPCERKSIYTDIQTLQDYGMDKTAAMTWLPVPLSCRNCSCFPMRSSPADT